MIGFPSRNPLEEINLQRNYPLQQQQQQQQVIQKQVNPLVTGAGQAQMQGQPQPRTGLAGLFDKFNQRSSTTGLSGLENFAQALDPLILPELRGGEAIRDRGAQRVKAGDVNKTIEYLKANGMADMAAIIEANPSAAGNVLSAIAANRLNPKDNRTTKMKDYKAAKDGGFAGSFTDFLKLQQSTTNIVNKQEAAYQKGMGEFGVELVKQVNEDADNAQNILTRTRQLERFMADPNFTSGALTDGIVQMRKIVETLGGDPANVSSMENFKAITSQLVLDSMGGSLGAGFSEGDRQFVVSIQPDLDKTLDANVALIDMQRKIANRKLLIADMAAQYIKENGQLDFNFKTELRAWSRDNPIFKIEDAENYFKPKGT